MIVFAVGKRVSEFLVDTAVGLENSLFYSCLSFIDDA